MSAYPGKCLFKNPDVTLFLVIFVFQCRETNDSGFVREQRPVCDLQAMEMKFKGGGYTSIVRFFYYYYNFQNSLHSAQ